MGAFAIWFSPASSGCRPLRTGEKRGESIGKGASGHLRAPTSVKSLTCPVRCTVDPSEWCMGIGRPPRMVHGYGNTLDEEALVHHSTRPTDRHAPLDPAYRSPCTTRPGLPAAGRTVCRRTVPTRVASCRRIGPWVTPKAHRIVFRIKCLWITSQASGGVTLRRDTRISWRMRPPARYS